MEQNELRVQTEAGEIIAYKNADPNHPGITLVFKPKGEDYEIDLMHTEVQQDKEYDYDTSNVHCYVYEDVSTEEYTRKFSINREEAIAAINDFN